MAAARSADIAQQKLLLKSAAVRRCLTELAKLLQFDVLVEDEKIENPLLKCILVFNYELTIIYIIRNKLEFVDLIIQI